MAGVFATRLSAAGTSFAAQPATADWKPMVRRGVGAGASEHYSGSEVINLSRSAELLQGRSFMHGDMLSFIAFDFILWLIRIGVMHVSFVIHVLGMNLDNPPADMSSLGIPGDVIADFETFRHCHSL